MGFWFDSNGRLFGRVNWIDGSAVVIWALIAVGVLLVQSGYHVTSGQVVDHEADIWITVQMGNVKTLDQTLFQPGKKTSITIRNQPRGEVIIENSTISPYLITLAGPGGQVIGTPDRAEPNSYNIQVVLKDHAKVTPDGYVTEGVKVKVGLPIELEGFKYRLTGKIVDVTEKATPHTS